MKKKLFLLALAGLFTGASLNAKSIVHTPRGLSSQLDSIQPGDTLFLADGIYKDIQLKWKTSQSGTSKRRSVLMAQNPGKVSFEGNTHVILDASNIEFNGIWFKNIQRPKPQTLLELNGVAVHLTRCRFQGLTDVKGFTIKVTGRHNKISYCSFIQKETGEANVYVQMPNVGGSFCEVDHCQFKRTKRLKNGGSGIRLGHGSQAKFLSYSQVHHNVFHEQDGESEIVCCKSSRNYIYSNTFLECFGSLSLRQGHGSIVEGNFFIGNKKRGSGGIEIRGDYHTIFNNYFYLLNPRNNGVITAGSASKVDPERIATDRPGRHFPLTREVVIAYNTIIGTQNFNAIDLAGSLDEHRPIVPEDLFIINNVVVNGPNTVHDANNPRVMSKGNWVDGSPLATKLEGFKKGTIKLSKTIEGLPVPDSKSAIKDQADPFWPTVDDYGIFKGVDKKVAKDIFGRPREKRNAGAIEVNATAPVTNRPMKWEEVGCGY